MEKLNTSIIDHDFSTDLNNIMSINNSIDEEVEGFEDFDIDFDLNFCSNF
ncbi:hypothetical protein [Flavobacterium sp.]|nr:hypothetical protein [Flavobacterium sp.]HLF52826.1 hypothetical protein [Flavobacterium sp.]